LNAPPIVVPTLTLKCPSKFVQFDGTPEKPQNPIGKIVSSLTIRLLLASKLTLGQRSQS
jgi:hypothetical protein